MEIYVAGAWVEQHERARPMMARLRAEATVAIEPGNFGREAALPKKERWKLAHDDLQGVLDELAHDLFESDEAAFEFIVHKVQRGVGA